MNVGTISAACRQPMSGRYRIQYRADIKCLLGWFQLIFDKNLEIALTCKSSALCRAGQRPHPLHEAVVHGYSCWLSVCVSCSTGRCQYSNWFPSVIGRIVRKGDNGSMPDVYRLITVEGNYVIMYINNLIFDRYFILFNININAFYSFKFKK